jgi:transcription termination/antitermination protein NusG
MSPALYLLPIFVCMNEKAWYVFYCKSRAEKKVFEQLIHKDFTVYLPLYQTLRIWSDRKKKVSLPMFPGYIFVQCSPINFSALQQTSPGLVAPVKIGSQYAILRQEEINFLQKIETNGIEAVFSSTKPEVGNRVKVIAGPLKDYEGFCMEETAENFLVVHVEAVNQYVKIRIHASKLEVLS